MDATISRGGTSVTLPVASQGGDPLVSTDVGKPHMNIRDNGGSINPRFVDQWNHLETFSLLGRFDGSGAYSDAIKLADLIKTPSSGNDLTLDIPLSEYDSNIPVAPAFGVDESLTLTYPSGWTNAVEVELSLTRVGQTLGGVSQTATTPTASGSGPIQLSRGPDTVDLVEGVEVSRGVGRPNDGSNRTPNSQPIYIPKHKLAYDAFELNFEYTENPVQNTQDITDLFSQQLGTRPLELDFNGIYNLGKFSVVPDGSQALRHTRVAGEEGVSQIPTVNLRRVLGR